jgi:uncharacterized protein
MQDSGDGPHFRELDREEIEAILARNQVGRLGYSRGNQMEIQPVHYVYSDGWLYGRTSYGAKYRTLGETAYQWWPVVFEVDEVEGLFRWRSVLVHGGFHVIQPDGPPDERAAREKAVQLLRTLIPETLQANDPVPFRTVLFRIAVQETSGREALPPDGEE